MWRAKERLRAVESIVGGWTRMGDVSTVVGNLLKDPHLSVVLSYLPTRAKLLATGRER